MSNRVLEQLGEIDAGALAPSPVYYGAGGEVLAAINEAQRFFVLLTLCLETTATFTLPGTGAAFFHMRSTYADWLLPLRVTLLNGTRVRPARIDDLDLLNSSWQNWPVQGPPARYVSLGFDFFVVYPQSVVSVPLGLTYARAPLRLNGPADTPEIPEEHHPDLADYATYRLRAKEGGQEFKKGLFYFNRFLDGAQKFGEYVRARNVGSGYDQMPFELALFDRSKLMTLKT
jgi:hypothetical protein